MKLNLLEQSPSGGQLLHQRRKVFQTRLLLSLTVITFTFLSSHIASKQQIVIGTVVYAIFHVVFGLFGVRTLKLKRVRFIRALADVALISFVTYHSGGRDSSWFVFYALPIISVSRFFGIKGSLLLAVIATSIYSCIYLSAAEINELNVLTLGLRCALFFAVAAASRDLSKIRELDELQPIAFFREIDSLARHPPNAYHAILVRALQLTNSDMGQIFLKTDAPAVASIGISNQNNWLNGIDRLLATNARESTRSSRVLMTPAKLVTHLGEIPELPSGSPRSVLIVPILMDKQASGVIAVYSRRRFHYSEREQKMLESLSSAVAIVLKHIQSRELLQKLATQLSTLSDLEELFTQVVDLVVLHCKSEEAALFVTEVLSSKLQDPAQGSNSINRKPKRILKRVAVAGATDQLTEVLRREELSYGEAKIVGGQIFPEEPEKVDAELAGASKDQYAHLLTSGHIRTQIAAPLIFAGERMGFLRALNSEKSAFSDDDLELLREIANQVAAAIHNARKLGRYEELVKHSPDPIIVLNAHSRIREFNKACEEIWRISADKAIGDRVEGYYESWEHAKKIGEDLKNAPHERLRNYPAFIKDVDEISIPISLSASILRDKNGKFEGSIGVFKDLRPMQILLDKVRAAETLAVIGRIARIAGHEIKNKMWIVINDVKKLMEKRVAPDELESVFASIKDAAVESIETLEKTLLSANLRAPRKKLAIVQDFFEDIHERMATRARKENIEFDVQLPKEEYEVVADVDQIELVLWNLYHNSIDAITTRRKTDSAFTGRISITTEVADRQLHLMWQDDGIGIPTDEIDSVFEAFFTKGKPYGTGLGLFLSRNVIEVHDGTITATSDHGAGACFRISLPLYNGEKE